MAVVLETTIGDLTIDLFTEERPHSCKNFLKLCKLKYYNFSLFHHIQANFVAQTGDPTGTGSGGESVYGILSGKDARYYEGEKKPKIKHDRPGLVSMVHCGNNLVGSQFFITLGEDTTCSLDEHIVFGEIAEGHDVLLKLNETICDVTHRPYQDIRITHTVILDDPYSDPDGLIVPDRSPEPPLEVLQSDRIGADEDITEDIDASELEEKRQEKEAQARATILEIVGDLPSADIAPPENVLFVCKLNPVTNDDDLQIIFSRFGKIVSCEVIRDKKSGNSLQYAFVEFDNQKSCEEAYLKMDNVLIDDRRIRVDFSQSVSKIKWLGKGRGVKYTDKDDEGKNISDKYSKYRNKKRDIDDSKNNHHREKIYNDTDNYRKDDRNYRNRESEKEEIDRRTDKDDKYKKYDRDDKDKRREKDERMRKTYRDERERKNYRNDRDKRSEKDDKNKRNDRNSRDNRNEKERRSIKSERERRNEGSDKNEKEYKKDNVSKKREAEQNGDKNSKKYNSNYHDYELSKQKQKNDYTESTKKSSREKYNNNDDEVIMKNSTKKDEKKSKNNLKKKKRERSSSNSSSSSSSSSDSSSSSTSTSSSSSSTSSSSHGAKIVKYYDKKGKLVKVVKNQDSSSNSDRRHKKRHRKRIVKVYKSVKRKRRSASDSTNTSSSESEEDRKKRKRKQSFKKGKKIKEGND
ncbi:peptidyl-prolyl cis-trans isomerase sig-7 [Sipha flava]|uniref:Peptidyl-prolyl cis-trans isomerase n=1 Tax=Sipha flava TaxID=143950 RepID=A0A2S2R7X6_9HEMI|nr:peptidyl-prolyl cis-trans isomerase sig-7 [Sipha flava]XP_025422674.1 peptidyl-prolyl cis-trans isomerase sig-7 [Sipha flava]XP_025422675.1 peptidyl-prolyl cis-trans isomerase sig-7 [Sipha flava]